MKTGDQINAQLSEGDNWQPAKVIAPNSQPQPLASSTTTQTGDGHTFRRNPRFLWRSTTQGPALQDDRPPKTAQEAILPVVTKSASPSWSTPPDLDAW